MKGFTFFSIFFDLICVCVVWHAKLHNLLHRHTHTHTLYNHLYVLNEKKIEKHYVWIMYDSSESILKKQKYSIHYFTHYSLSISVYY